MVQPATTWTPKRRGEEGSKRQGEEGSVWSVCAFRPLPGTRPSEDLTLGRPSTLPTGKGTVDPPNRDQNDRGNGAPHDADVPSRGPKGGLWWRSAVENSSENVTIVDLDGTLRYANPAFEQMLGYDVKEVVGEMNVLEYVHPDDLPHVLEETEKALSEGV